MSVYTIKMGSVWHCNRKYRKCTSVFTTTMYNPSHNNSKIQGRTWRRPVKWREPGEPTVTFYYSWFYPSTPQKQQHSAPLKETACSTMFIHQFLKVAKCFATLTTFPCFSCQFSPCWRKKEKTDIVLTDGAVATLQEHTHRLAHVQGGQKWQIEAWWWIWESANNPMGNQEH